VWSDRTAAALATTRYEALPALMKPVTEAKLVASAFVGVVARSVLVLSKDGVNVSGHETDAEITVTAWTPDQTGIGWAGQAARDWTMLTPEGIASQAIDLASKGANPVAIEPGRRTVIFGPAAVAQFSHLMPYAWAIGPTLFGRTPFSGGKGDGGTQLGELVMDRRVTIASDPADPEGGMVPFYKDGADGSAIVPMTWVENGVLKNLAFDPRSAAEAGVRPANQVPYSFRLGQDTATIESMIARCHEGLYVNRVTNVQLVNERTGHMSGVTQGGCFLVKDGRIAKPAKNLRFMDSPFVFLNNLIEIGTPHRAALGYTPGKDEWPLPPQIVPPLMVRDFNFTMMADAI
jgi:predicted Zn-dependent protease